MEKLSLVVAFLLLASLFQPLTARDLEIDVFQLDVAQSGCPGKNRWPELLGVPANLAKNIIQKENPNITYVPYILNGSPVPLDFSCNRVRLFVNILDIVVQTPVVT